VDTRKLLLQEIFPGLARAPFEITSSDTRTYNCFAWAVGRTDLPWDPTIDYGYWPDDAPREHSLRAFVAIYEKEGFEPCDGFDLEAGFEKIVLFVDGAGLPQHAARQLPNGQWTSKLGRLEDITHELHALAGPEYGEPRVVLRRPMDQVETDQSTDKPDT
jgi:hypothetical protein